MTLSAVILDYGEVISLAANQSVHEELVRTAAIPEETFEKYYWAYRHDYDAGALPGSAYWEKIAEGAGTSVTAEQTARLKELDALMWMDINESMLVWIRELKEAGLRLAILSNMGEEVLSAIRRDFSWLSHFDELIWSCEVGVAKPAPGIYLHAIEKLGIQPGEALFIDNLEENIRAAEAAGLNGIVFHNMEQLAQELQQRGYNIPLPRTVSLV